jgi:hypothetical protein
MLVYPQVKDPNLIGTYPALVNAGGGYVWDAVLEYRVWCHQVDEALDSEGGNDYYYVFETYEEASQFSEETIGAEEPIALVLQEEYIDEEEPDKFVHIIAQRLTEWPIGFLNRPRRSSNTIPDFFSPNAPSNRLDVLRGLA